MDASERAARRALEMRTRWALRKLRRIKGVDRINRRRAFMRQLPDDVRHEVARRAAEGRSTGGRR